MVCGSVELLPWTLAYETNALDLASSGAGATVNPFGNRSATLKNEGCIVSSQRHKRVAALASREQGGAKDIVGLLF
jgi:hypothetical protein